MGKKTLPSSERLHQLFEVDFDSGTLIWKRRPVSDFKTSGDCETWHIRFLGMPALATVNGQGYCHGRLGNIRPQAHSVIWCMKYGYWPKQIDHINGIRTDNRIANLREVTTRQNQRNRRKPVCNTSGNIGVAFRKESGRWRAYINDNRGRKWLGTFNTFEEAVAARKSAELKQGYHPNHGRS